VWDLPEGAGASVPPAGGVGLGAGDELGGVGFPQGPQGGLGKNGLSGFQGLHHGG